MLAFVTTFLLLFAETAHKAEGGFTETYNRYFNIPGFELWKFLNLAIFVALMVYLLKKPLGEAFKAKRDAIRAELIRAEQEKQAAMAKLTTAEAKLAQLPAEKDQILTEAQNEAAAEKARIAEQTLLDVERMKAQAESDLSRLVGQQRVGLRRFSAEETIRRAEELLKAKVDTSVDSKLVRSSIAEIGGLN
jgi:F0F1-type ATP synthase membrane subunit b/b'